ncbi:invasion associated locus B family protein [Xinfangfangia sp. CPCC 101601]|uniref:Invasion associated locus B family protein n=1 Tax=Pseudogemmobacter lacusdianii TaxID=3069608 RepID=A0ABU0VUU0_9RHOB|nr:invasion associated locus B family protein [Xinfangfangia sp. CPCC 101601]MDQ2065491.1 invasion associated locus B family protein [Xinfangfangia sp. CPCC 101601]
MTRTKFHFSALAFSLSLGLGLPAFAQEAAPAEAPAVVVDGASNDGLSMGAAVGGGAPAVGDNYVAAKFEGWDQRCVKTGAAADPCQLYLLLKDETGQSVAELSFFNLPEGGQGPAVAGATFIAPLETLLGAGVTIQVDSNTPRAYPFTFCASIGCVARLGFTAEEVAMFKKGNNAVLSIIPVVAPDQKVSLTASLKGFTAGLDAVTVANKAADEAAKAAAPAEAPAAE